MEAHSYRQFGGPVHVRFCVDKLIDMSPYDNSASGDTLVSREAEKDKVYDSLRACKSIAYE